LSEWQSGGGFSYIEYPSFVEVRARVFFELLSDEGRRWNFASCSLFVVVVVVVVVQTTVCPWI
jgi:hypothetical protein